MQLSLYLVAYIDLLGQSDELSRLPSISWTESEVEQIRQVVGPKAATIVQIREQLAEWQRLSGEMPPEKLSNLPPESRPQYARIGVADVRTIGFSDSFVVSCKLSDTANFHGPEAAAKAANSIYHTLGAVAGISLIALADRIPIRGGVEVGFAVDVAPNEVYGRVLMDAYHLESKLAEYPRTLIGPNLIALLQWLRGLDENQSVAAAFAVVQSKHCLERLICGTDDGFPMVHFLSNHFVDADRAMPRRPDTPSLAALRRDAELFVVEQERRFAKLRDHKLRARYHRLRRYFDQYQWPEPPTVEAHAPTE